MGLLIMYCSMKLCLWAFRDCLMELSWAFQKLLYGTSLWAFMDFFIWSLAYGSTRNNSLELNLQLFRDCSMRHGLLTIRICCMKLGLWAFRKLLFGANRLWAYQKLTYKSWPWAFRNYSIPIFGHWGLGINFI